MVKLELAAEMGALLETQRQSHGFNTRSFAEEAAGGNDSLFIEPLLRAASKTVMTTAVEVAHREVA